MKDLLVPDRSQDGHRDLIGVGRVNRVSALIGRDDRLELLDGRIKTIRDELKLHALAEFDGRGKQVHIELTLRLVAR